MNVIVCGLGPDTTVAIGMITCFTCSLIDDVTVIVDIGILSVPDSCNEGKLPNCLHAIHQVVLILVKANAILRITVIVVLVSCNS